MAQDRRSIRKNRRRPKELVNPRFARVASAARRDRRGVLAGRGGGHEANYRFPKENHSLSRFINR
jgi:hypothetical protein